MYSLRLCSKVSEFCIPDPAGFASRSPSSANANHNQTLLLAALSRKGCQDSSSTPADRGSHRKSQPHYLICLDLRSILVGVLVGSTLAEDRMAADMVLGGRDREDIVLEDIDSNLAAGLRSMCHLVPAEGHTGLFDS